MKPLVETTLPLNEKDLKTALYDLERGLFRCLEAYEITEKDFDKARLVIQAFQSVTNVCLPGKPENRRVMVTVNEVDKKWKV